MKRAFLVGLVLLPLAAFAKNNHPMAGCGLIYMAGVRDNEPIPQIVSSLFNSFFGTQTFGITSGTSGCTEEGLVAMSVQAEVYAEANFKDIQREIVAGGGEFLAGFADVLGVRAEMRPELYDLLQARYVALFPSANTSSLDMLNALKHELAQRPDLLS
ncbi:MAG: DUF3015 family protein [Elusimicrobia bacterium]|nr:DUF3015 family protein [Elusimicrobiota bacterium]